MLIWAGHNDLEGKIDVEDSDKTKKQLTNELAEMRQSVAGMRGRLRQLEAAERRRRCAEEAYRALVDCSLQGLIILQEGRIVFANAAFATMSGYTVDELLALSPADLECIVFPEDRAIVWKHYRGNLAAGGLDRHESRGLRKDGTVAWVEMRADRIEYRGKPAVQMTVVDVTERVQAESAIREKETREALILRSLPMAFYIAQPFGDYGGTWVSEQIDRISGFAAQQFLADTQLWASRLHPDDRAGALEAFESLLDKDTIKVEYRWQAADGRYLWFLDRAVLVRDESGEPVKIVGTWLDISERKEVEARLFTEKEFTDIALDAQVDTFFLFEPATGKALRWNRAFRDISGYTDEEIAKMPAPVSYYSPEDLERAAAFVQKVLVDGTGTIELELICRDGRRVPTEYRVSVINDDQGNPKYLISIGRDVTERKQAETEQARLLAQVQEQAQQVRQILDTVPEGVLLLDGDKQVVQANPLGKRDLVILADAQVGDALTHLGDLSLEKLLSLSPQGLWHETAADGQSFQVIARPIKAGNTPLGTPSQSGTGGWVVVIRDVTREREMQWRVQQQDRLAVIGQLAGGVAHDFNNVLTAIQGFTGLVLDELEPSDPIRADLEQVTRAADRAGMLTNQLLAFSRKQVLQPVVLDPNGAIADVEKMLRRLIGENISLHAALSPDLGQVMADPGQIEQVILNLAVNARDAMPRGGQLLLETKNVLLDEGYAQMHPGANPGAYVLLAVSDTGVGMSEQVKAHIFEPFFTTKEKTRGTGLGLATVHGIVTQSGGHIEVYSEPGVGTTFKIYLPRVDAETKAQRKPAAVDWQGTETVLLVEDDNVVRALARRSLERCGYTTLEARHADDALLVYERYGDRIDLVVTDVIMPGEMSGRDLAKRLVSLRPEIKVLYTSGYTDEAIVHHGVLEPGVAFLQKPFTPSSLAQKVREVLDAGSNPSGNTA